MCHAHNPPKTLENVNSNHPLAALKPTQNAHWSGSVGWVSRLFSGIIPLQRDTGDHGREGVHELGGPQDSADIRQNVKVCHLNSKNRGPWETPTVLSSLVQNTFIEELL